MLGCFCTELDRVNMFRDKVLLSLLLFSGSLFAHSKPLPPPPSVVAKQISSAETEYQQALKMFNPWYSGPLITGPSANEPPGQYSVQPYLYYINSFATFDNNRHSSSIPNIQTVNPLLVFVTGITNWLDITIIGQGVFNWQSGESSQGFGDTNVTLGVPLIKQSIHKPALRFTITESFPTGRYEKLNANKNGIDALGSGSYETTASLNGSKMLYFQADHPINARFSLNYTVPANVHVKRFNAYGGGYGTSGRVNPGNSFTGNAAIEYSFTQNFVFATDFSYVYTSKATFSGKRGVDANGKKADVGGPSSDLISFAPAFEYNPSQDLNFIAGVWFNIYSRNVDQFVSGIVSVVFNF